MLIFHFYELVKLWFALGVEISTVRTHPLFGQNSWCPNIR